MSTSITSSATEGQRTQYTRMVEDASKHGVKLALDKIEADSAGWQRVLENGDELRTAIAEVIVVKTCELSISNQFADEEVQSSYGYLSGYRKPVEIADQIDILRSHWPTLNPDGAIRYMREVYPTLQLPSWVEGPFALIRPGFFSNVYGEEVEEILKALAKARGGKFYNYRAGQLGQEYLRQSSRTLVMLNRILEQQNSQIIVVPEQFGIRHRGRSVRRAREVFVPSEFDEGAKNVGTMILTNPKRLQHYDDLWIDCAGDEFAPDADGQFGWAPFFVFGGGRAGVRRVLRRRSGRPLRFRIGVLLAVDRSSNTRTLGSFDILILAFAASGGVVHSTSWMTPPSSFQYGLLLIFLLLYFFTRLGS